MFQGPLLNLNGSLCEPFRKKQQNANTNHTMMTGCLKMKRFQTSTHYRATFRKYTGSQMWPFIFNSIVF